MLPPTIPIFPLPTVVLFPTVFLPLHIYESRYRDMVRDVLAGDRIIGMTLLKPGFDADYDGRPAVYEVGCAGLVTHHERLPDGRYNIVLRGLERFRIHGEDQSRPYRLAHVEPLPESATEHERRQLHEERRRLESVLAPLVEHSDTHIPADLPDDHLVNALSQYLEFEPVERQALLEVDGVLARCRALAELVEMKVLSNRSPSSESATRH